LVTLFYSDNTFQKTIGYVFLPMLVFLNNGFSEVMVVMQLIIFYWLHAAGFFRKTGKMFLVMLSLFFIVSFLLLVAVPGNFFHTVPFPALKITNIITSGLYNCLQVVSSVFKNPLAWLALIFLFFRGNYSKHLLPASFLNRAAFYLRFLCIALLAFLLLSTGVGVIGLKGGIVPDRFINVECWFSLLMLCMIAFVSGIVTRTNLSGFKNYSKELSVACFAGLIVCLTCNDYINTAYKSMLSAPLYNDVLKEREAAFKMASKNKTAAVVDSYDLALKKIISKKHPNSSAAYLKWALQKPVFIYDDNEESDAASIKALKAFYKVDSVIINK
jgi:hypothetical protein